jgi:hypothetical protein
MRLWISVEKEKGRATAGVRDAHADAVCGDERARELNE